MDTHRRAVESENEAFFLRISDIDNYRYEGADLGILVMRGRLMTDDFKLKKRAEKWINAMRGKFEGSILLENYPRKNPQLKLAVLKCCKFEL